jgi:glycosyltransferase involved in cell wall biosynthesis
VDEVWTATEYVAGIVRTAAAGRTPVFTVPLPLLAPTVSSVTREQLGVPADRFVFLFVFDFLSVMERKNPLGAIEAFCAAFAPGEGPVLVLKSINGEACVSPLERLRRAAAHRSDILIRDGYVGADEKNALLAACDCYVSLHRAEGLGLTLAEAMALGKPAIATGYSGNRHFMNAENSFLVEYGLTSASGDCGPYPPGARWAEPDLAHAARLMRAVYQHPGEGEAAGRTRARRPALQPRRAVVGGCDLESAVDDSRRAGRCRRSRCRSGNRGGNPNRRDDRGDPGAAG